MSLSAAPSWARAARQQRQRGSRQQQECGPSQGVKRQGLVHGDPSRSDVGRRIRLEAVLRATVAHAQALVLRDVLVRPGVVGAIERNAVIATKVGAAGRHIAGLHACRLGDGIAQPVFRRLVARRRTLLRQSRGRDRQRRNQGTGTRIRAGIVVSRGRARPRTASLLHLSEIFQIRRLLVLLGRHQQAVTADEVIVVLDLDMRVVLGADRLQPIRPGIGIARVAIS